MGIGATGWLGEWRRKRSAAENEIIEMISLLETRVGAETRYKILKPLPYLGPDILELQGLARQIATFVGLGGELFVVSVARTPEGVAGQVELLHGEPGTFIEISPETVAFPAALQATLAHEITHKYLHSHAIFWSFLDPPCDTNPHFNKEERLTDVTAVFLGLGKLLLNGCECLQVEKRRVAEGIETTTRSFKSGYLTRTEIAFAYRLVCSMRCVPVRDYESDLTAEALQEVRTCTHYFDPELHDIDAPERIVAGLGSTLSELESALAQLRKAEELTKKIRERVRAEIQQGEAGQTYDPCLRFLNNLRACASFAEVHAEVDQLFSTDLAGLSSAIQLAFQDMRNSGRPRSKGKANLDRLPAFLRRFLRIK